jgi:hypothetical protein
VHGRDPRRIDENLILDSEEGIEIVSEIDRL